MCVTYIILTSAYSFRNMRFFFSKTETSVFSIKKPTKLECVCIYIYWVNQGNWAISVWCISEWQDVCGWIFLQHYVITFCETIIKCAHVGTTVASKFDFTSAFLVWHKIRCTLLPDLWRLDFSLIISHHHNIQVLFAYKYKEWNVMWKLSLEVTFLLLCLCFLWHLYRDGYSACCSVTSVPRATPLHQEYLTISLLTVCIKSISW
jgi:hypothetical protein